MRRALILSLFNALLLTWTAGESMATERAPAAVVDLGTGAGAGLVRATWRYSDARIVDTSFRGPDAQGQPTGALRATHDSSRMPARQTSTIRSGRSSPLTPSPSAAAAAACPSIGTA